MRLGKIENGKLHEAGRVIMRPSGELVYTDALTENVMIADGWKQLIANPPAAPVGQCACVTGYEETDTTITLRYELRDLAAADRRAIADAIAAKDIADMTESEKTAILKYLASMMGGGR